MSLYMCPQPTNIAYYPSFAIRLKARGDKLFSPLTQISSPKAGGSEREIERKTKGRNNPHAANICLIKKKKDPAVGKKWCFVRAS